MTIIAVVLVGSLIGLICWAIIRCRQQREQYFQFQDKQIEIKKSVDSSLSNNTSTSPKADAALKRMGTFNPNENSPKLNDLLNRQSKFKFSPPKENLYSTGAV